MTDDNGTTPSNEGGEWKIIRDPEGWMMSELAAMYQPLQDFLQKFDNWEDEQINTETLPAPLSDMYVIRFLVESLVNKIRNIDGLIPKDEDLLFDDDGGEDDISPIGNL